MTNSIQADSSEPISEESSPALRSVEALSQLLMLNANLDSARAEITKPFTFAANRVTESAYVVADSAAGAHPTLFTARAFAPTPAMAARLNLVATGLAQRTTDAPLEAG